jgi:hypothetical protein
VAVNACIMGMSSIFGSPIGSFGAQFAATVCVGRTKESHRGMAGPTSPHPPRGQELF